MLQQSKQNIFFMFLSAAILLFSSCGSSPEKAIVNRWKVTDIKGYGHDRFLLKTAKAKEAGKEAPSSDLEFLKDNKFNVYDEEGVLKGQGDYSIAPDGKSLLLKQPNGSEGMPVQILSLSSNKLMVVSRMFSNDTVTMEPR